MAGKVRLEDAASKAKLHDQWGEQHAQQAQQAQQTQQAQQAHQFLARPLVHVACKEGRVR